MKKTAFYLLSLLFFSNIPAFSQMDMTKSSYTNKEVDLKTNMRKLFSDCLTWQRIYAIEVYTLSLDSDKAKTRLSRNQDEIGNVFRAYFNDDTANQMTNLSKQSIQLIADYSNTARGGGFKNDIVTKLHDNADAVADLLSRANMNWTKADLSNVLRKYFDLLCAEIDTQSGGAGSIDANALDATFDHCMLVSDMYALGIMRQYPAKFW